MISSYPYHISFRVNMSERQMRLRWEENYGNRETEREKERAYLCLSGEALYPISSCWVHIVHVIELNCIVVSSLMSQNNGAQWKLYKTPLPPTFWSFDSIRNNNKSQAGQSILNILCFPFNSFQSKWIFVGGFSASLYSSSIIHHIPLVLIVSCYENRAELSFHSEAIRWDSWEMKK